MTVRVTKRGELWSCCEAWSKGSPCRCSPYIVEFFVAGREVLLGGEGPRRSQSGGGS